MDKSIIVLIVQLVILIASFLVGKYVLPNISEETITAVTAKFNLIVDYADKFVAWAKQAMSKSSGEEKMNAVVNELIKIAEKNNIDVSEVELRAIAQKAYDSMKAGESSSTSNTIPSVTIVNTSPDKDTYISDDKEENTKSSSKEKESK